MAEEAQRLGPGLLDRPFAVRSTGAILVRVVVDSGHTPDVLPREDGLDLPLRCIRSVRPGARFGQLGFAALELINSSTVHRLAGCSRCACAGVSHFRCSRPLRRAQWHSHGR